MPRRPTTSRWILTLAVLGLGVNSFLPTGGAQPGRARGTNPLERWTSHLLGLVLVPVREPLYLLSTSMRRGTSRRAVPTKGEAALRRRLAEATARRDQLQQRIRFLKRENQRLTGSRRLVDLGSARLEPTNVTGLIGQRQTPMLELDAGRSSGIRPGLAVVAGASLVGRIESASRLTSRVRLLIAGVSEIRARIAPANPANRPGAIIERVHHRPGTEAFTVDVPKDSLMQVGDLAHLADERWPWPARGFLIGKVTRFARHPDKPLLLKRVVIEPIPALRSLSRVTVLVPKKQ